MARIGVLLIHGLSGSPHEFAPASSVFEEKGYVTKLVTLPGHGDSPKQRFHDTSVLEILNHCALEYEKLTLMVDEIYIIGHSLGGICTILTAAMRPPKLKGILVFSAPYEYAYFYNYLQGLTRIPFLQLVKSLYYAPRDGIRAIRPKTPPWRLPRILEQSRVIFKLMRENINQVNVPVGLVHSVYDLTIPYSEMEKLSRQIGAYAPVKMTTLQRSGHRIFPVSKDHDEAITVMLDFIQGGCDEMLLQQTVKDV